MHELEDVLKFCMFDFDLHKKYFMRHLFEPPQEYEHLESTRMLLLFYSLSALKILHANHFDEFIAPMRSRAIEWIYSLQVQPSKEQKYCGFIGSDSYINTVSFANVQDPTNLFDVAHLNSTHLAILCLLILKDDLCRLNRLAILETLKDLQLSDGSFKFQTLEESESDNRFVYSASVICHLLEGWDYINMKAMAQFIKSCSNYDGGFGIRPGLESHAGSTFCAISSLKLMEHDNPEFYKTQDLVDIEKRVVYWLSKLQSGLGGFSGRANKDPDTCYCFWAYAALVQLGGGGFRFFDVTQDRRRGGFCKTPMDHIQIYIIASSVSVH
ncbi:Geranylgeranyl transferase type-1 subunit beta [Thelohanellus kitauei]|uniref:Geranylgeranyl transferase type-1 subunit beta n=1 Tax=Thelohanellus kitauei TaxID=669202 RepID=A0A0C2M1F2_THEKT|nr:Geranylgeranyl transferase type-1 subunit beta [Thelohanellus kitauei]